MTDDDATAGHPPDPAQPPPVSPASAEHAAPAAGPSPFPGSPPRRARDPGATRRGVRAALVLFAVVVATHVLTLAAVKLEGDSQAWGYFLPEGALVALLAFAVFLYLMITYPPEVREPFFITSLICMAASVLVWTVTCAVAM